MVHVVYEIFVFSVVGENVATRTRQGVWKGGHDKSVGSQVGLEREREGKRMKESESEEEKEKRTT